MEDGDEFGDLYTDVLTTFPASPPLQQQEKPPTSFSPSAPPPRPIDADDILSGTPNSDVADQNLTPLVAAASPAAGVDDSGPESADDDVKSKERESGEGVNLGFGNSERTESRVFGKAGELCEDHNPPRTDVGKQESGDLRVEESVKRIGDVGWSVKPIIPGVSPNEGNAAATASQGVATADLDEGGSSDSEDDLQIVLNDHSQGPAAAHGGGDGEADEDEDGKPLVIVGNNEATHMKTEELEWSEAAVQSTVDGERNDTGSEPAKANGGTVIVQNVGYSNRGCLPFHSQFKVSHV